MKNSINEEIITALKNLGVRGEITLSPTICTDKIKVSVNGQYFGLWDTVKKTFVD